MRAPMIAALVAALFALCQVGYAADAPGFELEDLEGDEYTLEDLLDECDLLVIAFWEHGCIPCTKQLIRLQEYYDEYQEEGIEFIVISCTKSLYLAKVKPFFETHELTFRVLQDIDGEVKQEYGVKALPASFVINPEGQFLLQQLTYKLGDESAVLDVIQEHLKGQTEEEPLDTDEEEPEEEEPEEEE